MLEAHGWRLDRINRSHYMDKQNGNRAMLTDPAHSNTESKPGLMGKLLKLAELTENDL